jgi:hypothetical protein
MFFKKKELVPENRPLTEEEINRCWHVTKIYCKDKLNEEIERQIKFRKEEEENAMRLEAHKEAYPIGSYIEYLGIRMRIKTNTSYFHAYDNSTRLYYNKPIISLICVWADKNNVLHQKEFTQDEFNYIKKIYKYIKEY